VKRFFLFVTMAGFFFTSCRNDDYYKELRIKKADEHFKKIVERQFPQEKVFNLPDCLEIALKNNFDIKVYELKESISKERRTAALLGMLPDLNVTNDLSARSNEPGASSQSLSTGEQSLVPSKSTEKTVNTIKVEFALSMLDFGLAYFNSVQAEDRVQLSDEQLRRAAQNLILDVTQAYFKVAATQHAVQTTEKLLEMCDNVDTVLMDLTQNKTISPLRALDERKRFITLRKSLMEYRRSYQNSCVELKSLMGYHPAEIIKVNTDCLKKINVIDVPDIDLLERIALKERPELFQLDMEQHITIVEARKTLLMMCPNVRLFVDFTNSSNKFLYNQSWWEAGVRTAYNLLKLPEQIQQYRALDKEADQVDVKTISMAVAVMAQVRIAHANMMEVRERYDLDKRIYDAYNEYLEIAKKNSGQLGNISPIEITRLELETAETAIDRANSLGNYYLAYYRLLNMMGIEAMEQEKLESVIKKVKEEADLELKTIKAKESQQQQVDQQKNLLESKEAEEKQKVKELREDETVIPKSTDVLPEKVKDDSLEKLRKDIGEQIKVIEKKEKREKLEIEKLKNKKFNN